MVYNFSLQNMHDLYDLNHNDMIQIISPLGEVCLTACRFNVTVKKRACR